MAPLARRSRISPCSRSDQSSDTETGGHQGRVVRIAHDQLRRAHRQRRYPGAGGGEVTAIPSSRLSSLGSSLSRVCSRMRLPQCHSASAASRMRPVMIGFHALESVWLSGAHGNSGGCGVPCATARRSVSAAVGPADQTRTPKLSRASAIFRSWSSVCAAIFRAIASRCRRPAILATPGWRGRAWR